MPLDRNEKRVIDGLDRLNQTVGGVGQGAQAGADVADGLMVAAVDADLGGSEDVGQDRARLDRDLVPGALTGLRDGVGDPAVRQIGGISSQSEPPRATFSSWQARQMPRAGIRRRRISSISAKSARSRSGVIGHTVGGTEARPRRPGSTSSPPVSNTPSIRSNVAAIASADAGGIRTGTPPARSTACQ